MFIEIVADQEQSSETQSRCWLSHDNAGNAYTLTATALGPEIIRVLLRRGARLETQRYQLASGSGDTLPYHSWIIDTGDESWPVIQLIPEHPRWSELETYCTSFSASSTGLRLTRPLHPQDHIYGLGERTGPLDKQRQAFPIWNIDPPQHHTAETVTMYASIPFYLYLESTSRQAHGVLVDHTGRVDVDLGKTQPNQLQLSIENDVLAVYFLAGPAPADVMRQYSALTGRMALPPLWALGHHQCRWGYQSAAELREIASKLRSRQHPCDALWLDIDYMDGYRNFTWNAERFPEPAQLIADLHQQGLHLVTILDPGTKRDDTYAVYQQGRENDFFCRYPNGDEFLGSVWPGTCVFPDFSRQVVREWWGNLFAGHVALGVDGIWNDMNEPALTTLLSQEENIEQLDDNTMDGRVIHQAGGANATGPDGPPVEHHLFHNAYGMQMARATYEGLRRLRPDERVFVLTRSATAGSQRYAAVWTGDNTSKWDYIPQAITMCLNLSMSGVPFIGMDIGGFWEDSNGQLLTRFAQLGAFIPFCRNHSSTFSVHQEPWAFGEPFESAYRAAIEVRYRCLPYLYTLFAESARTGAPIIRPLYYHYPQDERACQSENQLLIGETLLSAPICEEDATRRAVYLPTDHWFDYWSGQEYRGGHSYEIEAPLERWPLFVRANSILPMGPLMQHTGERASDPLTIHCYMREGGEASYTLYEDDGATQAYTRGLFAETFITCRAGANSAVVEIEERFDHYHPQRAWYEVIVHLNGRELTRRVQAGQRTKRSDVLFNFTI